VGVLMVRVAALSLLGLVLVIRRPTLSLSADDARWLVVTGVLDSGAKLLFALAADAGGAARAHVGARFAVPGGHGAARPAVLHERLERHQAVGAAAALTGVAPIAGG
jgi:hypothetical protein